MRLRWRRGWSSCKTELPLARMEAQGPELPVARKPQRHLQKMAQITQRQMTQRQMPRG